MALNTPLEKTLRGTPVKQEPRKTGRQYGTMGLTYPFDLGVDANTELDNHIIFDIFYDETTSFSKLSGTKGEPKAWTGHSAGGTGQMINKTFDDMPANAGKIVNQGATAIGIGEEKASAAAAGTQKTLESLGNFVSSAFAGAKNLKKLNQSIALAVPNALTATSTANYTEAKMGPIAGALARMGSGNMQGESTKELAGQAARLVGETMFQIPDAFGMNLNNIMEVTTRRVQNPHIEQRFESISFREFQFVYEFAAKSRQEVEAIHNIINTFRFHMHPELVSTGLFFDYPSLFDISIRFKEEENRYMHRISTCYLTSFTTNYTSTGVFSTNRDGQPTEIQCTMNFREIEPLHKHRIEEGF
jgi:hypothetical protein